MADDDAQDLLVRLDRYFDAAPRSGTRTEEIGPFTLFINEGIGWRYYARPRLGESVFEPEDVRAVIERQRTLNQPRQFEWIEDVGPTVGTAIASCGLTIAPRPLLHLKDSGFEPVPPPPDVQIRFAEPDDDLATMTAVAMIGFGSPGTGVGKAGIESLAQAAASIDSKTIEFARSRIAGRSTRLSVAFIGGDPVASGSHQPVDGQTEITGVACLPAFRRRGLGAAVTSALAVDAGENGVHTICLSAGDETIARVYERVGFRRVGTVAEAVGPQEEPS